MFKSADVMKSASVLISSNALKAQIHFQHIGCLEVNLQVSLIRENLSDQTELLFVNS
jgi:hypothetical protein